MTGDIPKPDPKAMSREKFLNLFKREKLKLKDTHTEEQKRRSSRSKTKLSLNPITKYMTHAKGENERDSINSKLFNQDQDSQGQVDIKGSPTNNHRTGT